MGITTIGFYVAIFTSSFVVAWLGIRVLGANAKSWGLVDDPCGRKVHAAPVPLVGGLALAIGAGAAVVGFMVPTGRLDDLIFVLSSHVGFFIGAVALLLVGVIDDRRPVPAIYKLMVQIAACAAAVFMDDTLVGPVSIAGIMLTPGPLVIPFTILVMLTIINAINMIDGLDGLAAGITFAGIALISKAVIAAGYGSGPFVLAFLGGLAGFLIYNFPFSAKSRARVFLGDSGSLFLGFALAYMTVDLSALPNRVFSPGTALWFFFIPVADTIWLYLRRTIVARSPFSPGRDHIHHLLLEYFPAYLVTWILVGVSAVLAAVAYLCDRMHINGIWLLLAWLIALAGYGLVTHNAWRKAWARSHVYRVAEPNA